MSSRTVGTTLRARTAGAVVALLLLIVLTGCDSRSTMTPDDVVAAFEAQPTLPVTNPEDVTDDRCGDLVLCDGATESDELIIYQFSDRDNARAFAETLDENGHQSDWIVLEYKPAGDDGRTAELSYASILDSMWTSDR